MGATAPPVQASGQLLAFSTMSPLQTGPRKFYLYTHHLQLVTMPSPTQVCFPSQGFRCARWGHGTYPSRPGTRGGCLLMNAWPTLISCHSTWIGGVRPSLGGALEMCLLPSVWLLRDPCPWAFTPKQSVAQGQRHFWVGLSLTMTTGQHGSRVRVTSLEFPTHTIPQPMTQMVPKAEEAG